MAAIYLAASPLIAKLSSSLPLPLRVGIEKARTVAGEIRKAKNEQANRAAAEAAEQDRQQQLEKERAARKLLDDLDVARASPCRARSKTDCD